MAVSERSRPCYEAAGTSIEALTVAATRVINEMRQSTVLTPNIVSVAEDQVKRLLQGVHTIAACVAEANAKAETSGTTESAKVARVKRATALAAPGEFSDDETMVTTLAGNVTPVPQRV